MEGRRVGEGGDMTRKSPTGEGIMKIGGRNMIGRGSVFLWNIEDIFLVLRSLVLGFW